MTSSPAGVRTVDIARWQRQQLAVGALVPTLLGLSGVVAAVAGLTTDGAVAERVIVGVLGAAFLAVGVGLYGWLFRAPPRGWLDVDDTGVTRRDRSGPTWHLGWDEIRSVSLVRTRAQVDSHWTFRQAVHLDVAFPRHYLRLGIDPAAARRPELAADRSAGRRKRRSGPVELDIDLGVPAGPARDLLAALGPRVQPPRIVRLGKDEQVPAAS